MTMRCEHADCMVAALPAKQVVHQRCARMIDGMLSILCAVLIVHGDSIARDVVAKSAAAIGGFDRLRAMQAIRVEEAGHEYMIGTPELPESPKRIVIQSLVTLRRYGPGVTGVRE